MGKVVRLRRLGRLGRPERLGPAERAERLRALMRWRAAVASEWLEELIAATDRWQAAGGTLEELAAVAMVGLGTLGKWRAREVGCPLVTTGRSVLRAVAEGPGRRAAGAGRPDSGAA